MTRWLRFFITAIPALFRRKVDPSVELKTKFWTWITDADLTLVNNAVVLGYTEMGRVDFLFRSRLVFLLLKEKIYSPAAAVHITFLKPLRRFQRLELRTKVIYWDPKWVWLSQEIYSKETLVTRSIIKCTFRKGKETIPFDQLVGKMGFTIETYSKPPEAHLV